MDFRRFFVSCYDSSITNDINRICDDVRFDLLNRSHKIIPIERTKERFMVQLSCYRRQMGDSEMVGKTEVVYDE
jgi:hypothetical protein